MLSSVFSRDREALRVTQSTFQKDRRLGHWCPACIPHGLRAVPEALYTFAACACQGAEWAATASDTEAGKQGFTLM